MEGTMLQQILDFIHNYFYTGKGVKGEITIERGRMELPGLLPGQYYHITGSVFNDGVHSYYDSLKSETFEGVVYYMAIPQAVLDLVEEIEAWMDKYGEVQNSPFQSESVIGVYQYQRATTGKQGGESVSDWQSVFAHRLNIYRKVSGR